MTAAGHVTATAVDATTEAAASTIVGTRQRVNARARPTARNGSAGMKKRGPGESPPYGS